MVAGQGQQEADANKISQEIHHDNSFAPLVLIDMLRAWPSPLVGIPLVLDGEVI
jgi:hypothetical protein